MRGAVVRYVGVVMSAQDVRRTLERVVADPPAALRMTVHLADAGIDAHRHSADQRGLAKVGAEPRPEVVIDVGSPVEGPRVQHANQ